MGSRWSHPPAVMTVVHTPTPMGSSSEMAKVHDAVSAGTHPGHCWVCILSACRAGGAGAAPGVTCAHTTQSLLLHPPPPAAAQGSSPCYQQLVFPLQAVAMAQEPVLGTAQQQLRADGRSSALDPGCDPGCDQHAAAADRGGLQALPVGFPKGFTPSLSSHSSRGFGLWTPRSLDL